MGSNTAAVNNTALDGQTHSNSTASLSTIGAGLTTTQSNDVVIAIIALSSTTARTVSSVTCGGLTWTKHASIVDSTIYNGYNSVSGYHSDIEVWTAIAATPLTAQVLTVALSGAITGAIAEILITAFAVSGANTSTPFGAGGSMPLLNLVGATGVGSTISTAVGNTFVFGVTYGNAGATSGNAFPMNGMSGDGATSGTLALGATDELTVQWGTFANALSSNTDAQLRASTPDWLQYVDAVVST